MMRLARDTWRVLVGCWNVIKEALGVSALNRWLNARRADDYRFVAAMIAHRLPERASQLRDLADQVDYREEWRL